MFSGTSCKHLPNFRTQGEISTTTPGTDGQSVPCGIIQPRKGPGSWASTLYDGAHNHPVNRALHLIAIPVGFSSIIVVWFHWIIALLLIPTAFALAWLGHLIEGNKRAFLSNPVHVFVAPLWMARRIFGKR